MPFCNPFYWLLGMLILGVLAGAAALTGGLAYLATLPLARKLRIKPVFVGLPVAIVVGSAVAAGLVYGLSHLGWLYPEPEPDPNKIVGAWAATAATVKNMEREGGYTPRTPMWTFQSDGTFVMEDMPDWWLDIAGQSHQRFDSGSGRWSLSETRNDWGNDWEIMIDFQSLSGYPDGLGTTLMLDAFRPDYVISVYLGDPDSGRVMEFNRTELNRVQ